MKENSIEENIKNAEHFIDSIKTDKEYKEENGWHGYYNKEIVELARILEHILSDYKRLLKENEELKQNRNNNYQMIALAQNEALGYMQGYEDGKKLKRSAVANIVENQQYYVFNKQIEHYKEYIVKLQKENEKLKNKLLDTLEGQKVIKEETPQYIKENYILKQKVKDKIEEIQIEYNKLDKEVDEYINDTNKDLSKYYENKEKIGEMQTLSWCIDNLQELLVSN